ncbi:hypothetical protein BH09SUM1_BH09SUM1_28620 [soil metagenome]
MHHITIAVAVLGAAAWTAGAFAATVDSTTSMSNENDQSAFASASKASSGARVYTFDASAEGWTFGNPLPFSAASGTRSQAAGTLDIQTTTRGVFAFFESPMIDPPAGTGAIYRATFRVSTDQTDRFQVPQIRYRASSENFEQTNELIVTSTDGIHGRAFYSPLSNGHEYEQLFTLPSASGKVRLDFDVQNGPEDAAASRVSLDNVQLDRIDLPATTPASVLSYDFSSGDAHGFQTLHHPTLTPPQLAYSTTSDGLSIQGDNGTGTTAPGALSFGCWTLTDPSAKFEADRLYRVDWQVASDATSANSHSLPTFRLRVNSASFMFASLVDVEPGNATASLPSTSGTVVYTSYFRAPVEIDGEAMIFSFDYLGQQALRPDATLRISLRNLSVTTY